MVDVLQRQIVVLRDSYEKRIVELESENAALRARVADLEAQLRGNSRNSSSPPSTDGPAKPATRSLRRPSTRKPGGQDGHQGRTLEQVAYPDVVIRHEPVCCRGCGSGLAGAREVEFVNVAWPHSDGSTGDGHPGALRTVLRRLRRRRVPATPTPAPPHSPSAPAPTPGMASGRAHSLLRTHGPTTLTRPCLHGGPAMTPAATDASGLDPVLTPQCGLPRCAKNRLRRQTGSRTEERVSTSSTSCGGSCCAGSCWSTSDR